MHLNDHIIASIMEDVIFSEKFLLKPLHYHLLPGLTLWRDVLLWNTPPLSATISQLSLLSGVTRHLIFSTSSIISLKTGNHVASLSSVFGLLSIYQICDYVQFFEVLSPVYLTIPRCFAWAPWNRHHTPLNPVLFSVFLPLTFPSILTFQKYVLSPIWSIWQFCKFY